MENKKIEVSSYNLNLIKTDKFKSIFIKFIFRDEIKKEEITIRNFLLELLSSSCKKYATKRLMSIKKQELYDLGMFSSNRRIGNHIVSELNFQVLNPEYSDLNIIKETIAFIKEIIFNPNVSDNKFNEKEFNLAYNILKESILEMQSYPKYYSVVKMKESMDSTRAFSYRSNGYLEDLEHITRESLYAYYQDFIKNSLIDIYVVGNINFYEMEKLIKENMSFKTIKKPKNDIMINYSNSKRKIKEVMETNNLNQSRVVIGCSFTKLTKQEQKYTLVLYNMILGNSPDSKLFKNVRESQSLCYDIESTYNKNDNMMIITTGIDKDHYELTKTSIINEMKKIQAGDFSLEELNNSKEMIISLLKEFEDYPSSIIEYYFSIDYLNADKVETVAKKINSITKEDIIIVAKKIKIDTIYLLKGE